MKNLFKAYQLMHDGALVLTDIERNGIKIDSNYLQATIGSATDNTSFEADGTMVCTGSASTFDDLPPFSILAAKPGANAPTLATFVGNVEQYTFDATNDLVFGVTEVTHAYKEGSDIECHIHWATNGTDVDARGVKWQLEYGFSDHNSAFSATNSTMSAEATIAGATADRTHLITALGTISGTVGLHIGAYICWALSRVAATGSAPTGDPFAIALGFHVEQDTLGSRTRYGK